MIFNFNFKSVRWSDYHRGWLIYFNDNSHLVATATRSR